ncbi:MAG: MFS transporter [Chthoniobacteraceae bacterium]
MSADDRTAFVSPPRSRSPPGAAIVSTAAPGETGRRWEHAEFAALFFLQAGAIGMWQVCFGSVLKAHGLERFIPYAYACTALSAFVSPMFVGALADQRIAPTRLLRWLSGSGAAFLALAFVAIDRGWGAWWMLAFVQLHALCATPTFSLLTSIVFARLREPSREFGPLRAWATFGWIAAGWTVSWILKADATTGSGYAAAATFAGVSLFSFFIPVVLPTELKLARSWRDLFGLEALELLRDRDHRVVFLTAALYNAPLAAFYPYAPIHLRAVGVEHATAVMTLGQVTEILAMFWLANLLARVRLKWLFLIGIGCGVLRYALFALNTRTWLFVGITLHGFAFALYFITAQLYVEHRVEARLRTRAQALLALMSGGFGNLFGALGAGWWRLSCAAAGETNWPLYWLGLSGTTALVFLYFAVNYKGSYRFVARPKLD